MPVLLSSLTDVPAAKLAGALGADESRCCLREWLASVSDPRSGLGRWHPLLFVLALAVCAFTAARHDSLEAIAEWAACCSQQTMAALGGRRDPWTARIRPPSVRTFSRIFARIDAEAFNAAVYGYLAAPPPIPAQELPAVTRHEREQRRAARPGPQLPGLLQQAAADGKTVHGAVRPDGSQVHLLSVFDVATGTTRTQREAAAKNNEIPELAPAIACLDLTGQVVTLDALRTRPGPPNTRLTPFSATWSPGPSVAPGSPTSSTLAATMAATTSASSPSTDTPEKEHQVHPVI